ncbi:protein BPS1, chloroplastic-like [Silene latifolia]|uniref:protein BPS1, chloroplastic-like n=1 Tax=Silene latifolia TaxID=37657 RepID=UPI003D786BB1
MVVLISKLPIFLHKSKKSKLDQSESIAFQSFQSTLSENLHKLFSDHKNGLNYASLSLSWYIPSFKFIQGMNKAFAKLVKDLDYPVTKWQGKLGENYFSYTLNMLDVLNSISSSISNLGSSRLSISHAITLIASNPSSAIHHLKPIIPKKIKDFNSKDMSNVESFNCGKERVIHEAMMKMRSVDLLILKVLFRGLSGERIEENGWFNSGEFDGFNLGFGEEFVVIKEIKEVNEVVKKIEGSLVGGKKSNKYVETEELKRKLNEFESLIEMVEKEVNCLFSEVLARRNELINCFRLPKCA